MTVTANSKILRPSDPGTSIRLYVEASVLTVTVYAFFFFFLCPFILPPGWSRLRWGRGTHCGKTCKLALLELLRNTSKNASPQTVSNVLLVASLSSESAQVRSGVAAQVWRQLSKFILQRTSYCHLWIVTCRNVKKKKHAHYDVKCQISRLAAVKYLRKRRPLSLKKPLGRKLISMMTLWWTYKPVKFKQLLLCVVGHK